jgi:transposase
VLGGGGPGMDRAGIEGIDELHALTRVSGLGTHFTKWPMTRQFTSWLGLCPNRKKTGAKVKSSQTRRGKNRAYWCSFAPAVIVDLATSMPRR